MEDLRDVVQRAKVIVPFPEIGMTELIEQRNQLLLDIPVTVFETSHYYNEPPSEEGSAERDIITGRAPQQVTMRERIDALHRLVEALVPILQEPGLVIINDNCRPSIDIIGFMEEKDLDFKMISPASADINRTYMPTYKEKNMRTKWIGIIERLKDDWDEYELPARKKMELAEGQYIQDVIQRIMDEPIPLRRPADDPNDWIDENGDGDGNEYIDHYDRRSRHTDNKIGSNSTFSAWLFSFSNIIGNAPYRQHKAIARTKTFFSWFFFLANVLLTVCLAYILYHIVTEYEEFTVADVASKRAILEEPSDWVEESPFYIWTAWPKKLLRMALPYAKRRQVSEGLLDTVEKWVHTERFLRGSEPGWQFSEVLQRLKLAGFITSDAVKEKAYEATSKVASTVPETSLLLRDN